ncbi:MAG TPA: YdeI/OmpD-associated family protein [Saprospiraceae bacterium]|nr:YdeI/OmpD-associated family protein [Saprospiraceae bacterium]
MPSTDSRIDQYIGKAEAFAQPVLKYLRQLVHETCPEVVETMKWSFPHFDYRGEILCSMAAFKQHCAFGFYKEKLMTQSSALLSDKGRSAMGDFGRISSIDDLPSKKVLETCIREAMQLNEQGVKLKKEIRRIDPATLVMPDAFRDALEKNPAAKKTYEAFSNSHKREYLEYINEAKRDETKQKRIAQSILWLSEGKSRNHKYENK